MDTAVTEVADLALVRQARRERFEQIARRSPHHPALRWYANGDTTVAHRRRRDVERTACDLPAVALLLADADTPLCAQCYPAPA